MNGQPHSERSCARDPARVKRESPSRGASFLDTLNDPLRAALLSIDYKPRRRALEIQPTHMGYKPGLNYDNLDHAIRRLEQQPHGAE